MELRVGYIKERTMALGPGVRFVIWTQGCSRRCKGCISSEFQPIDAGYLIDVDVLASKICSAKNIDGITISGGEPFLQAKALCELTRILKDQRPDLNIIVFTGNQIEKLTDNNSLYFLKNIDLLIDGEYIAELNNNKGLRGSSNQRFHFISERLVNFKDELINGERKTETHWADKHKQKLVIIGVPRLHKTDH